MNTQLLSNLAEALNNFLDQIEKRSTVGYEVRRRQLENKINQVIQRAWVAQTEKARKQAVRLLEQYGRQLEKLDAQAIADGLAPVMGSELVQVVADEGLVDHVHYAYDMAGVRMAKQLKLPYALTFVDQRARDWLVKDTVYWIGNFYNEHIRDAVTKTTIQYAIEEGQNYWTTGQRIKEVLAGTYDIPPKYLPASYVRAEAYWQLVSCEAVTRATVFGSIEPMLAADVEEYEILTAEDERVCPLCGRMHGKKFKIKHAVELRDKFLNSKTPEDAKLVHPWHRIQEIDSWEPEALARKGMSLPSFHGHCRCDIVVSKFREYTKSLEPVIVI